MFNMVSEQRLNARFFVQNITQVDTYFSIKHWFGMQRALNFYTGQSSAMDFTAVKASNIKLTGATSKHTSNGDATATLEKLALSHSSLCFAKLSTVLKLLK